MNNKLYNINNTISSLINNEINIVKFINTNIPVLSTVTLNIQNKTKELSSTIDTKFWNKQQTSAAIDTAITSKIDLTHYIRDDKDAVLSGTFTTTSGFYINEQKIEDYTYNYIDNKFQELQKKADQLLKTS